MANIFVAKQTLLFSLLSFEKKKKSIYILVLFPDSFFLQEKKVYTYFPGYNIL